MASGRLAGTTWCKITRILSLMSRKSIFFFKANSCRNTVGSHGMKVLCTERPRDTHSQLLLCGPNQINSIFLLHLAHEKETVLSPQSRNLMSSMMSLPSTAIVDKYTKQDLQPSPHVAHIWIIHAPELVGAL